MSEVKELHHEQDFQRETGGGIQILYEYATIAKRRTAYLYRSNGIMLIHNLGGIVGVHTSQLAAAWGMTLDAYYNGEGSNVGTVNV